MAESERSWVIAGIRNARNKARGLRTPPERFVDGALTFVKLMISEQRGGRTETRIRATIWVTAHKRLARLGRSSHPLKSQEPLRRRSELVK